MRNTLKATSSLCSSSVKVPFRLQFIQLSDDSVNHFDYIRKNTNLMSDFGDEEFYDLSDKCCALQFLNWCLKASSHLIV